MYAMAKFQIIGRVGKVDCHSYGSDGEPREMASLSLAVDDFRRKDEAGEPATDWLRVAVFSDHLVKIAKGLKGRFVYLEGDIRTAARGEGEARTFHTNFVAAEIGFLDPKPQAKAAD